MFNKKNIKLSIIIPTIGRKKELGKLLDSLNRVSWSYPIEIIIIDQNEKGYLYEMMVHYKSILPVKHIEVNFKGLSKAKNFGVEISSGCYLSFPDDDCEVFEESYRFGCELLDSGGYDLIFGKCIDKLGEDSVCKFKRVPYELNLKNMIGGFVEATVICKREVFVEYKFDENMGAGCFFGAEEGYDWLYRILKNSLFKAYYNPKIVFYHPQIIVKKGDYESLNRVFKYRAGKAYLFKKHNMYIKYIKRLMLCIGASAFYLPFNINYSKYYLTESCALIVGWILKRNA